MKKNIIFMLILVALLSLTSCGNRTERFSETGFDSPEDAIITYLEGLRDSDLERMVSAFAIETLVENFSLEEQLNRFQVYDTRMEPRLPNTNEFITEINVERRRGSVVDWISRQIIFLSGPDLAELAGQGIHRVDDESEGFVRQFNESLDALNLQSIEILGFIPLQAFDDLVNALEEHLALQTIVFNSDQLIGRIAVFELDGETFFLAVDVVNYDGRWYILHLGGGTGTMLGFNDNWQGILLPRYTELFDILQAMVPLSTES